MLIKMFIHLYRLDKNWKKKGVAENLNLIVNYEFKTYKMYINSFYGYDGKDSIEVKKKSDIFDYMETLKKGWFTDLWFKNLNK